MIEYLQQLDQQLMLALNGHFTAYTDQFMYLYSGKWEWIPFYLCIARALVKWRGWRQALVLLVTTGLIITVCDQLCGHVVRNYFERPRPSNPAGPIGDLIHIVNGYRGGPYGFPSCHAANAFGLAVFISLIVRERTVTAAMLIWAVLTAYSRIVLGVHYPGDLLVGAITGSLVATAAWLAVRRWLARHDEITSPATVTPWILYPLMATVALMAVTAIFLV